MYTPSFAHANATSALAVWLYIQVLSLKGVPFFTVRCPLGCAPPIDQLGNGLKVRRVDAEPVFTRLTSGTRQIPIVAEVIDLLARWDLPLGQFVGNTVSVPVLL
jgi:hypothetical protein